MRKYNVLPIVLCSCFSLVGCKFDPQKEFNNLTNSISFDMDIRLELEMKNIDIGVEICNIKHNDNIFEYHFGFSEGVLRLDGDKNRAYYYSNAHPNISAYYKQDDEETLDFGLSNFRIEDENLYFNLNCNQLLGDLLDGYDEIQIPDSIECKVVFDDEKVSSIRMDVISILEDMSGTLLPEGHDLKRFDLIVDVNGYGEDVQLEDIVTSDYSFVSTDKFNQGILNDIIMSFASLVDKYGENTNNQTVVTPLESFHISMYQKSFTLYQGGTFTFNASLLGNRGTSINLTEKDFTFTPQIDTNVPGNYTTVISCEAYGEVYETSINVIIKELKYESLETLVGINKVENVFQGKDGKLLISDSTNIYVFNPETKEIEKSANLKCAAEAVYYKGDYLYVVANYPTTDLYLDSKSYRSTISKIKLSDFTVEKQITVSCLANSIIVDKEGNVLLSTKSNRALNLVVDLETETITEIAYAGREDYLIYIEDKDQVLVIDTYSTAENYFLKYEDGKYVNEVFSEKSTLSISKVSKVEKDYLLILGGTIYHSNGEELYEYGVYNPELKDYVCYTVSFGQIDNPLSKSVVDCENDKFYLLSKTEDSPEAIFVVSDKEAVLQRINLQLDFEPDYMFVIDSTAYVFKQGSNKYLAYKF